MARPVELPNDLVDEILYRVPATSLKRLQSTCKRWNRLFKEDRKFASEHRDKAAKEFLFLILTEKQRICPLSIINGDDVTPLPSVEVKRELSLPHPRSNNSPQFDMTTQVFHCDGLLLCVRDFITSPTACHYEIVVWNPFTGQTRWIEADNRWKPFITFVLGYNNKSSCSQRILCFDPAGKETEIYDLNSSDSWRRIPDDGDLTPPGWTAVIAEDFASLKGNTYFIAKEESEPQLGLSLLKFDFSTEKSSPFVRLPYQRPTYEILRLSAVRDEKLSVFLQPDDSTCKTEIWVTSKIDDDSTKAAVSWNKVLAFDLSPHLQITDLVTFVLDEDKKVAVCCERWMNYDDNQCMDKIYILGEDNQVSEFGLDPTTYPRPRPFLRNYVPSLVQIELPAED